MKRNLRIRGTQKSGNTYCAKAVVRDSYTIGEGCVAHCGPHGVEVTRVVPSISRPTPRVSR